MIQAIRISNEDELFKDQTKISHLSAIFQIQTPKWNRFTLTQVSSADRCPYLPQEWNYNDYMIISNIFLFIQQIWLGPAGSDAFSTRFCSSSPAPTLLYLHCNYRTVIGGGIFVLLPEILIFQFPYSPSSPIHIRIVCNWPFFLTSQVSSSSFCKIFVKILHISHWSSLMLHRLLIPFMILDDWVFYLQNSCHKRSYLCLSWTQSWLRPHVCQELFIADNC